MTDLTSPLPPPPAFGGYRRPWGVAHCYPTAEERHPGQILPAVPGPYGSPAILVTGVDEETGEAYGRYLPALDE